MADTGKILALAKAVAGGGGGGGTVQLNYVTPETYGAVGDGVTDDSAAVQAAINAGYDVYFASNKTYYLASAVTVNHDAHLHGGENTVIKTATPSGGTVNNGIIVEGTLKKTTTLTTNYSMNGTTANSNNRFTLTDMEGINIGDLLVIKATDQHWHYARQYYYLGAVLMITDIYDGHLYTSEGMPYDITNSENVTVKVYSAPVVTVENLHFVSDLDSLGAYVYLLWVRRCKNSEVKNCTFMNMCNGLRVSECVNTRIDNVSLAKSKYDNTLNGDGYGIVIDSCTSTIVERVIATCAQHAISITGELPAINTYIRNCELTSECRQPGLDTHEAIYNLVVEDSVLGTAALNGICTVSRCKIINNRRVGDSAQGLTVFGSHDPERAKYRILNTEFIGTNLEVYHTIVQTPVQSYDNVWGLIELDNCIVGSVNIYPSTTTTILSNTVNKLVLKNCESAKEVYHTGSCVVKSLQISDTKFTETYFINSHSSSINLDNIEYIDYKQTDPLVHKIYVGRDTKGENLILPKDVTITVSSSNASAQFIVCGQNLVSNNINDYRVGDVSGSAGGNLSRSVAGSGAPTIAFDNNGKLVYSQGTGTSKYSVYPVGMFYAKDTGTVTLSAKLYNTGSTSGAAFRPFIAVVDCATGKVVDRYSGSSVTATAEGAAVSYTQVVGRNKVVLCYFYCASAVASSETTFDDHKIKYSSIFAPAVLPEGTEFIGNRRTGDGTLLSVDGINNIMCSVTNFHVSVKADLTGKA